MATSKDLHSARSTSQHRLSMSSSTASASLPLRQSHSRHHSHSVSLGSLNPTHRVTRRKSMSSTSASNMAAVAAAVQEATETTFAVPLPPKKGSMAKSIAGATNALDASAAAPAQDGYPSPPSSLPNNSNGFDFSQKGDFSTVNSSAIVDGHAAPEHGVVTNKARMRRASEGAHVVKGDGKRASGSELRCEKCGKGYKHSSCLTKHLFVTPLAF